MTIELSGQLLDGETSRPRSATLRIHRDASVALECEGVVRRLALDELRVPARLGETVRRIRLPGGAVFETFDNDGVDALVREHLGAGRNWVYAFERRMAAVAVATLAVVAAGVAFAVFGIPALARSAAFAVSPEQAAMIGAGTLEFLDTEMSESDLLEEDRVRLGARFAEITADAPPGYDFELVFRRGGSFGANAFALPSGTVVLTDELVDLAQHEDEIVGVLAHEVGHVVHRHGLRHAIQGSALAFVIVVVTGDLSSTSGFVAAVPTLLAESRYSRDFEREADDHAAAWMRTHDIPVAHFAALLARLGGANDDAGLLNYLSSHPASAERIARLQE